MKRKIFTTVLSSAILRAACSKDEAGFIDDSNSVGISSDGGGSSAPASNAYASGWESPGNWTSTDSSNFKVFTFNRSFASITSDVLNNGVVMVWAKNFPVDPNLMDASKPQMMPFYLFPDNERPKYSEFWYSNASSGNITVKYRTNNSEVVNGNAGPSQKVQYRYFVIPADVLEKKGLNRESVSRMSYQEIANTIGVSE
jgi:hypothetical protein